MGSDLLLLVLACTDPAGKQSESGSVTDSFADSTPVDSERTESSQDSPLTEPCEDQGTYYQDVDGDGYGAREEWKCEPAPGWVSVGGDCDDTDPSAHPGAEDVPDNAVDEDCDGLPACGQGRVYGEPEVTFTGEDVEADLAAFCEDWDMVGWLIVEDAPALTSLQSLSCLCYIDALIVWDGVPALVSSEGLEHLTDVGVVALNFADAPDVRGLEGLTAVGDLSLGGIQTARGLERLRTVRSDLYLEGTFSDFTGLEHLATIGQPGDPTIFQVRGSNLTSFAGMESLTTVFALYVDIDSAGNEPTDGFARLEAIEGDLRLKYAPTARGYESLRSVTRLYVGYGWDNPVVVNLDGLGGLEEVTELLAIFDRGIEDIDGLTGLTTLPETQIGHTLLTNVDGLAYVTQVDGDLFLWENEALESLDGLHRVERITGGLLIEDNPNLPDAEIEELIRHIGEDNIGYLSIGVNGG